MRYIRTNYEIYDTEDLYICDELNGKPYATNNGGWVIYKESIVKEADTIEELCDEFIVVIENKPHLIPREWLKQEIIVDVLYGAIWTDKGLIYVAKMNDKGELVVL